MSHKVLQMRPLFQETLAVLDIVFSKLQPQVPPPQPVRWKDGFVHRYVERSIYQAILLKLVRFVTGLRAALVLLENGQIQEQAVLHRILDELGEDIQFLVYALTIDEVTDLHKRYLDAFFQEEFSPDEAPIDAPQKRPMIPRQKIQNYLATVTEKVGKRHGQILNRSHGAKVSRTIHKAYSGFVHAAAPHIMDLYGGNPPRFYLQGMLGTPRMREYERDLWNYFYRGEMAFLGAALAFGNAECEALLRESLKRYDVKPD